MGTVLGTKIEEIILANESIPPEMGIHQIS